MADRDDRKDWRRERSLLALGQSLRGEDESPAGSADASSPSFPRHEDAVARHRMARSRRYGETNPLLTALGKAPGAGPAGAAANDWTPPDQTEPDESGLARFLPHWARLKREHPQADVAQGGAGASSEAFSPGQAGNGLPSYAPVPAEVPVAPVYNAAASDEEWKPLIDPMKVFGGIFKSKLLILATTALGAFIGVAIALSTPKKYEAFTELIVDPRDLKLTDKDLTQNVYASDATLAIVQNQVRLLTSGAVLNKVVQKLDLANDPEFNGEGKATGIMARIKALIPHHAAAPAANDQDRRWTLALNHLSEAVSADRAGQTFVVTIGVTTEDGEKSAKIANTMTDVLLQTYGDLQADTAGRATDELSSRLDEMRKGVETAERKVEDFRATHDLIDAQGHLITDDELLKLNDQLATARARTLELNARAASARAANVDSVIGGNLPEELNSSTMSELRLQYAALKQEADSAAIRLGPRHPQLLALNAQLAGARDRIQAELRRIASSLQVDLKRAVQLEQDLASRLAQAKVRSGDVNNDLVTLRELEREANAKRTVYESFLVRAKETGEQKDINPANINVISKAYAPLDPIGPSRAAIALAGMMLGFASGVGLGAMRGAYESLRESADSRRRKGKAAPVGVIDPPPSPPGGGKSDKQTGALGSIMTAMRKTAPQRPQPAEAAAWGAGPVGPASATDDRRQVSPSAESAAYPAYPGPQYPQADPHARLPRQAFYPGQPYPQPYPVPPHPMAYPHPGQQPMPVQPWTQQPMSAAWQYTQPPFAADSAPPAAPGQAASEQIEEIRASLREFREAVRELTENKARRRYF